MVIEISRREIIEYEKLKIISQLAMIKEKDSLFKHKYGCSLAEFRTSIEGKDEQFEEWDDFIEWTAYTESENDLRRKLDEIENAQDINITTKESSNKEL